MANLKSSKKRARQTIRKTKRNTEVRSSVKTALREARLAIDAGSKDVGVAIREAISGLAKAANKGIIHKNNASRKISRLLKKASTIASIKTTKVEVAPAPAVKTIAAKAPPAKAKKAPATRKAAAK